MSAGAYQRALSEVMAKWSAALEASAVPAPQRVWWRRLLRQPGRRYDPDRLLHELAKIKP